MARVEIVLEKCLSYFGKIKNSTKEYSVGQKHSIFVCRDSGAFNSFLTKIACSAVPRGFVPRYATGSYFFL